MSYRRFPTSPTAWAYLAIAWPTPSRLAVEPTTRVKHYRLFDQAAVETIKAEMALIADERPVVAGVV